MSKKKLPIAVPVGGDEGEVVPSNQCLETKRSEEKYSKKCDEKTISLRKRKLPENSTDHKPKMLAELGSSQVGATQKLLSYKDSSKAVSAVSSIEDEVESVAPVEDVVESVAPMEDEVEPVAPMEDEVESVAPMEDEVESMAPMEDEVEPVAPMEDEVEPVANVSQSSVGSQISIALLDQPNQYLSQPDNRKLPPSEASGVLHVPYERGKEDASPALPGGSCPNFEALGIVVDSSNYKKDLNKRLKAKGKE